MWSSLGFIGADPTTRAYAGIVAWLLLLLIPIALLMFAVRILEMRLMLRELRTVPQQVRNMPRTARIWYFGSLGLGVGFAVILIRAFEGHGRQTLGYALLAIFGSLAVYSVFLLPLLLWRQERKRRARLRAE
jgi:hypothetical protein